MSEIQIRAKYEGSSSNKSAVPIEIEFSNPRHQGMSAKFRICHHVRVKDRDPENADFVIHEEQFTITDRKRVFEVPSDKFLPFGYFGSKIDITCQAEVVVDDAIFFDSKHRVTFSSKVRTLNNEGLAFNSSAELTPHDDLNFYRNFLQLSFKKKVTWIIAFLTLVLAAISNLLVAIYDSFIASVPLLYSGEPDHGMIGAGVAAILGGKAFSKMNKEILRSYKTVEAVPNLPTIRKGARLRLSDLVTAKSEVYLYNVTLRLVVANLECGQYWRGSGTDRSRVNFAIPRRAMVLYESEFPVIPKGAKIEKYFNDRLELDRTFESFLPNLMISDTHGVKLQTFIQVLVGDLADTYLELPSSIWHYDDFTGRPDDGESD